MMIDSKLDIRDLTCGEFQGSGLYEELMRTAHSHLKEEYSKGRIVGSDYTNAYIGSLQAALQGAIQYLTQYLTVNKNLELLDWQVKQAEKQNELLELQKEQLCLANQTAAYNLKYILPEQYAQALHATEQASIQTSILREQLAQAATQTSILGHQEDQAEAQAKISVDLAKDMPMLPANVYTLDKTKAESQLMNQKYITEVAQTEGSSSTIGGLVGQELLLKAAQTASFTTNSQVQAAKLFSDTFSLLFSTAPEAYTPDGTSGDPNSPIVLSGFSAAAIKQVMDKVRSGIGALE